MINILLQYTFLVIFLAAIVVFLAKYTKSGFLDLKAWLLIGLGLIILSSSYFLVITGSKINERVQIEFNVPKDFYSEWLVDSIENPVSDKILYDYLINMRAPHPKIIVAQAVLESNNFTSDLYKRQRNFIGMKYSLKRVTTANGTKGEYKRYDSWEQCVTDYLFWVFSNNADKLSQDEYFRYLGKVYAEDPNYIDKLKTIIKKMKF